jgi:hypothetical protein
VEGLHACLDNVCALNIVPWRITIGLTWSTEQNLEQIASKFSFVMQGLLSSAPVVMIFLSQSY